MRVGSCECVADNENTLTSTALDDAKSFIFSIYGSF